MQNHYLLYLNIHLPFIACGIEEYQEIRGKFSTCCLSYPSPSTEPLPQFTPQPHRPYGFCRIKNTVWLPPPPPPPRTKLPPFRRRYFQMNFREWTFLDFDNISLKFVLKGPIGLDNGLVPYKRQAIIWTNADPIHWRIYTALGGWCKLSHWGRDKVTIIIAAGEIFQVIFFTFGPQADGREAPVGRLSRMYL